HPIAFWLPDNQECFLRYIPYQCRQTFELAFVKLQVKEKILKRFFSFVINLIYYQNCFCFFSVNLKSNCSLQLPFQKLPSTNISSNGKVEFCSLIWIGSSRNIIKSVTPIKS